MYLLYLSARLRSLEARCCRATNPALFLVPFILPLSFCSRPTIAATPSICFPMLLGSYPVSSHLTFAPLDAPQNTKTNLPLSPGQKSRSYYMESVRESGRCSDIWHHIFTSANGLCFRTGLCVCVKSISNVINEL